MKQQEKTSLKQFILGVLKNTLLGIEKIENLLKKLVLRDKFAKYLKRFRFKDNF